MHYIGLHPLQLASTLFFNFLNSLCKFRHTDNNTIFLTLQRQHVGNMRGMVLITASMVRIHLDIRHATRALCEYLCSPAAWSPGQALAPLYAWHQTKPNGSIHLPPRMDQDERLTPTWIVLHRNTISPCAMSACWAHCRTILFALVLLQNDPSSRIRSWGNHLCPDTLALQMRCYWTLPLVAIFCCQ